MLSSRFANRRIDTIESNHYFARANNETNYKKRGNVLVRYAQIVRLHTEQTKIMNRIDLSLFAVAV